MSSMVTLMIGTNDAIGNAILDGEYPILSWWSDNLETVAHYYEGKVLEITIELFDSDSAPYVRCFDDLGAEGIPLERYAYGSLEVRYPVGAIWYSFSGWYLKGHVISCKEIFPDLSMYNEEK